MKNTSRVISIGILIVFISLFCSSCKKQVPISNENGGEFQKNGWPLVIIPPQAISDDGRLEISRLSSWDEPIDSASTQIDSVYEITLNKGSLHKTIELALPTDLSEEEIISGDISIGYYDPDSGWVTLPSWYSESDKMVHATTNHLSVFGVIFSPLPVRPKITHMSAYPNPFQGVGSPPCFDQELEIQIGANDPNGSIKKVEVSVEITNFNTQMLTLMMKQTQTVFTTGLILYSGGVSSVLPLAQGIGSLAEIEDPGLIITEAREIEKNKETGFYTASIDLSPISACKFDTSAIMKAVGLEKIVIKVKVTDDSDLVREDRIEIPVHSSNIPYGVPESPGAFSNDLQSSRPNFSWHVINPNARTYTQKIVFAKGDTLWERSLGKKEIDVKWNLNEWQLDEDLKPGDYVWGIEIEDESGAVTSSNVFHFSVSKLWANLKVNEYIVIRDEVIGDYVSLKWMINRNGELILAEKADENFRLDLHKALEGIFREGKYTIWLEAVTENFITGSRTSKRISDIVTFVVAPTPTPTLTPTPTSTPTLTPTPTSTPTKRPTKTNTPKPSYPTLRADKNYMCRSGPGKSYKHVADVLKGESHRIIATSSNGWYAITINVSYSDEDYCWIGDGIISGDLDTVEYIEVPDAVYLPIYNMDPPIDRTPSNTKLIGYIDCRDAQNYSWDVYNSHDELWVSRSSMFGYQYPGFFRSDGINICGFDLD